MSDEEKGKVVQALWSALEAEAACAHLLDTLDKAREAMRAALGGGSST